MGAIGGLLGTAGGAGGTGYTAPQSANIQAPTSTGQINSGYNTSQSALGSQQALLNALQSQNGLGNQTLAFGQQQALANQLAGAGGVQNLGNALSSQQALAAQQQGTLGQYQAIANGQGPNPAQNMLNQATGQNVANQAALMAGQRGAGANVGLIARQAAQQGANTQQQAAGQVATLQSQQQLNALSGLSAQQQAIGSTNQNVANIAAQQIAQQQAQQQALAGQANTLAAQQIGATTTNTQAAQNEQSLINNALGNYNNNLVGMQGNINSANAGLANTVQTGQQGLIGGVTNSLGSAAAVLAEGGEVKKSKHFADGGDSTIPSADMSTAPIAPIAPITPVNPAPQGPQSKFGQFLKNWENSSNPGNPDAGILNMAPTQGAQQLQQGVGNLGKGIGTAIKNHQSSTSGTSGNYAGSDISDGSSAEMLAAKGGMTQRDFTGGGNVKAKNASEKAVKAGNSYDNDKIPAVLSEGEVVIPRNVMQSQDPVRGAADFVAKVMAKRKAS